MVRNPAGVRYPTAEARVFENATTPVRKLPLESGVGLPTWCQPPFLCRSMSVLLPSPGLQSPTAQSCFVPGITPTDASSFVAVQPAPSGTVTAFQPEAVCFSASAWRDPAPRPPTAHTVLPTAVPPRKNDSPPRAGSGVAEMCQPDAVRCSASGWSDAPATPRWPNAHRLLPLPAMPKSLLSPFGSDGTRCTFHFEPLRRRMSGCELPPVPVA